MRVPTVPAVALAALLALGGLAAAQDAGSDSGTGTSTSEPAPQNHTASPTQSPPHNETGSGSHPPSQSPPPPNCDQQPAGPARERCIKERYCHNNPTDARCGSGGPANHPANGTGNGTGKPPRPAPVDRFEHIAFTLAGPRHLTGYGVDGQPVLDSLLLDTGSDGTPMTARNGDAIVVGDADTRLRLHDNPVGLIEFKGEDGSVVLGFPASAQVTTGPAQHGARIHYADGRDGLLVADQAAWSGHNVTLRGFFSFHIARSDGPFEEAVTGGALRSELQAAVETRHLGAEVVLDDHPANASRAVQVLAYDDMSVHVQLPTSADGAISVQLAANLTQGRTIALHVDPALVGNSTPDRLVLHYFDDHTDGTRTEVVFAKADSLADVLDPTNDAGRPEYWVVQDADGLQVLVSVPHWSTHTVTLAGLGVVLQPSVLMGLVAGAAGTAVAAVAMFWPRRQR